MSKEFCSKIELHKKLLDGIDILADNVASTLGPKGRNVILQEKNKMPIITKDGVTVAKFVDLADPIMNAGAQIVKQASAKTNVDAGDGTTTSTVLTRAIYSEALKQLTPEINPVEVKRGIDKAVFSATELLKAASTPVTSVKDIAHIASISANNDASVGKLISLAVDRVGKDGSITIEEGRSVDTTLDLVEGFTFDSGYAAGAFVTDERRAEVNYESPLFFMCDFKIEKVEEILPVLELAAREGKPLVMVAEEIEGQALAALIMNTIRGSMKVVAVKAPRYGEDRRNIMSDLALATGGKYFRTVAGDETKDITLEDFGRAKSILVSKNSTTVVSGAGRLIDIDKRIESIKGQIEETESLHECEVLQERLTRLASGVAVIKVGAPTKIEMIEKKHRIEDALEAVRSAQLEGIIPGGGVTLYRISKNLTIESKNREQDIGLEIVKAAIRAPFMRMAENSGIQESELAPLIESLDASTSSGLGINFATGNLVDLFEEGIIDPAKVTRCALQNAASVAGTLLTTNYAIIE